MFYCSVCNTFHYGLDSCPAQSKPIFEPYEIKPPKNEPLINLEPMFKPLINLESKFEPYEYQPPKIEPLINLEPKLTSLINLEPKFEPYKYEPPKITFCGEPCCPGHSGGFGGRCLPRAGPGMGLGPPGGLTW